MISKEVHLHIFTSDTHKCGTIYGHIVFSSVGVKANTQISHQMNMWIWLCKCWTVTQIFMQKQSRKNNKFSTNNRRQPETAFKFVFFLPEKYFNWTFSSELLDCDGLCDGYQCSTCFPSGWLCYYPYNFYCILRLSLGN